MALVNTAAAESRAKSNHSSIRRFTWEQAEDQQQRSVLPGQWSQCLDAASEPTLHFRQRRAAAHI